jgi:hypothetical protein
VVALKWKRITFFLLFLLTAILVLPVRANVTLNQGFILKTTSNNAQFSFGSSQSFWKYKVNSTHIELDQSYSWKHYTQYFVSVSSPSNTQFSIMSWFSTIDSSAQLTISSPTSTDITIVFQSPNFISASATGVKSQSWNSGSKNLSLVVNTATSSSFTVSAIVNETYYDASTPENVSIMISNFPSYGNFVFATEAYTYVAKYWDGDGYLDLDTMKMAFTDGVNWVNASYKQSSNIFTLDSGSSVCTIGSTSSTSVVDSNVLQVNFVLTLGNQILDHDKTSLYMWCNDTAVKHTSWQPMQSNYFEIFNEGGNSEMQVIGNAGRIAGGEAYDLYAYNNSWVGVNMTYRYLQHIKLLPTFQFQLASINPSRLLSYRWYYCTNSSSTWMRLIRLDISWVNSSGTIGWGGTSSPHYTCFLLRWYVNGLYGGWNQIKTQYVFPFQYSEAYADVNQTVQFWIDLWINKENASSVISGRFNAYYFPVSDSSNNWLHWFTGSTWGLYERRKQDNFAATILDNNGKPVHAAQIELMKFGVEISQGIITTSNPIFKVSEYDVFDLTFGSSPLQGILTPSFDETRMPQMAQGGFLGWLGSTFGNTFNLLGPILSGIWKTVIVPTLDQIFSFFGWHNGFSQILTLITDFGSWLVSALSTFITWITLLFNLLSGIATELGTILTTVGQIITTTIQVIAALFFILTTGSCTINGITYTFWTAAQGAQVAQVFGSLIILIAIMLPVYEVARIEQHGFGILFSDIGMLIDVMAFILNTMLQIVHAGIALIGHLIDLI